MKNHLKKLIAAGLWMLCFGAYSQVGSVTYSSKKIMTLQEIIAGVEQHPSLKAYSEKISSLNAYSNGARSLEAPKLTGGFWMTPYPALKSNNAGMDQNGQNSGALMIGVEQMIMNPSRRKAEQRYMQGMSKVEETMQEFDRQEMIRMTKMYFYEWLIQEKKLKVFRESEGLLELMIKSAEINYTYNQGNLSRIYKAKSELYSLQNMQLMTESEIRKINIQLNTLLNIEKSITYDIDTNYTVENYDALPADTSEEIRKRSDVRNIEESIKLNQLRNKFEMTKRNPDFGIQYAHMNGLGTMPNQFNLMGMITVPFAPWSSKGYKANRQGLRYELAYLDLKKKSAINEAIGKIEMVKSEISNTKKQLQMYEKNILPALQKNYQSSLISFEHMKEDMFMTIDAWVALKMAKIQYLELLGQLLQKQTEYERAVEK